jgi:hypothetical protein
MTVTKIIGPNVGADFATPALWFASFPSTLIDNEVGNFQNAEVVASASQALTGVTAGSFTVTMQAGAGNSFADNAGKLTNALAYNASNGAALRVTASSSSPALDIQCSNFALIGIQVEKTDAYGSVISFGNSSFSGRSINQVIAQHTNNTTVTGDVCLGVNDATGPVKNVLCLSAPSSGAGVGGINNINQNCVYQDITIVNLGTGVGRIGFQAPYGAPLLNNVVVAGFATDYSGTAGTCANNATDKGTFGGTNYGTSGQVSVPLSTATWQNITPATADLRAKSSGTKLPANGTNTGTPSTDIVGTTRASPTTIGAWEASAGGGGGAKPHGLLLRGAG